MKLDYEIFYSNRKTLNITVERDRKVIVRAPKGTLSETIRRVVESKKPWLFEKFKDKQKYPERTIIKEFVSGESFLYLGRNYKLKVVSDECDGIKFDHHFIISKHAQPKAPALFRQWYTQKAKEKIIPKVKYYAKHLGVDFNDILISNMRYRWGSCTAKKNLNYNWRLIKAPMFVIDYVVVHELAHLLEHNHTMDFWNIVSIQVPSYKTAKDWLVEHGTVLEEDL